MKEKASQGIGWKIKLTASILLLFLTLRFYSPLSECLMPWLTAADTAGKTEIVDDISFYQQSESEKSSERVVPVTSSSQGEAETASVSAGYETPRDVLGFEQEYLAAFSQATVKGDTEEVFFSTSGATDIVSGISIKNTTATKKPDFEALLEQGTGLEISDKSSPLVLIFHTHTTESYLLSDNGVFYEDYQTRSTDNTKNMVRVGDEICRALEENGIGYIHDTAIYDESYEGAYGRSRVSVEKYLNDYPTIQIVIDVHRDAIYYSDTLRCKPTAEIDGRKAAQIMIITGAEEGYITDFPNWEDNLKFALAFQKRAQDTYNGLMKPLYFCQRKYNMDLGRVSLLFEMGTDANTLDEAMYSGYLAGTVLAQLINETAEKG